MSFLRHEEIYRSDVRLGQSWERQPVSSLPVLIGCDEFPVGYSLAGCPPAEPASASPTGNDSQQPTLPYNDFSANGNYPLNFVSQSKGALQTAPFPGTPSPKTNLGRLHKSLDTPLYILSRTTLNHWRVMRSPCSDWSGATSNSVPSPATISASLKWLSLL
jgi:hypothetical protein